MQTWAGLSGFASPHLQRHLYQGRPATLETYGDHFNLYEMTPSGDAAWTAAHTEAVLDQAPSHVRLLPRLSGAAAPETRRVDLDAAANWLDALRPLLATARAGPILVPWDGPWSAEREADLETLLNWAWPRLAAGQRVAVELRHASWFNGRVMRLLEEHGVGLVWSLRAGLAPYRRTSDFLYVRLTGHNRRGDEVARLLRHVNAHDDLPLYVVSTHHHEPYGLTSLRRFLEGLSPARSGTASQHMMPQAQPVAGRQGSNRPPPLTEPLW